MFFRFWKAIKTVDSAHTSMISEVIQISVLIQVNPATIIIIIIIIMMMMMMMMMMIKFIQVSCNFRMVLLIGDTVT